MEEQLVEAMEDFSREISDDIAHDLHDEVVSNIQGLGQGADGLEDFVEELQDEGEEYSFRIAHPVAPLHEVGGHIEPRYSRAKAVGWTRDEFYEALEDCNEWVTEKRPVRDAMFTIRREYST